MEITAQQVKELREATGAGVLDCRKALQAHEGNMEQAAVFLRAKGLAAAAKKEGREAHEGLVELYTHGGGRVGVMVEVNCETDFVARTDQFQKLVRHLAMQVAGMRPLYVGVEHIPAAVLEAKQAELLSDEATQKKPEAIRGQIVDGQLKKWYKEVCLLEQPFRDTDQTIASLISEAIATIGENIRVRRFERYELGEEL